MKRSPKKGCNCGGGGGYVLELDVPTSKTMLPIFQQAGYKVSDIYTNVGVFYVQRNGLTASGPFGGIKIQVKCGGTANCSQLTDHLENTFKVAAAQPPMEPK